MLIGRGDIERDGVGADAGAGGRGTRGRARRRPSASELEEKLIAGVPARIMRPRLVFIACLGALLAFGLLMVYSASSVEALQEEDGSSTDYLFSQARFVLLGLVVFAYLCSRKRPLPLGVPWACFRSNLAWLALALVVLLLFAVLAFGAASGGATRWIVIGSMSFQPSELAKPAIILVVSNLLADFYEECSITASELLVRLVIAVGVPLVLIVVEPDVGTTLIIALTVFAMLYLAGISYKLVVGIIGIGAIAVLVLVLQEPYRLTRVLVAMNPWSDPYGDGYQATLAIMAFASGGLFGRGIGNSVMKYNYLPEAHNDYIVAIIGEELGMVGTLVFLAVYVAMIVAAFCIARRAPSLHAQLLASGSAFILALQAFINILGILSVIPMTGKGLPFISYGGSSMISSLILAAFIFRVSLESNVVSEHELRRGEFAVMSDDDLSSTYGGRSTAGVPRTRSATLASRRADLHVVDGGGAAPTEGRGSPPPAHGAPEGGYARRDLSDVDAADRLRGRSGARHDDH